MHLLYIIVHIGFFIKAVGTYVAETTELNCNLRELAFGWRRKVIKEGKSHGVEDFCFFPNNPAFLPEPSRRACQQLTMIEVHREP